MLGSSDEGVGDAEVDVGEVVEDDVVDVVSFFVVAGTVEREILVDVDVGVAFAFEVVVGAEFPLPKDQEPQISPRPGSARTWKTAGDRSRASYGQFGH